MNKADLVEALAKEVGLSKAQAKKAVELFFDAMAEALANGDRVEIRGFCSILAKKYKTYAGRNPNTGALTQVAPKKLPFCKPSKELKERVDR